MMRRRLRPMTALLVGASGAAQVAALWFRELDDAALLDALAGAAYLVLALGLLGQSRFSLFLGIALPAAMAALQLSQGEPTTGAAQIRLAVDLVVPPLCALVLLMGLRKVE